MLGLIYECKYEMKGERARERAGAHARERERENERQRARARARERQRARAPAREERREERGRRRERGKKKIKHDREQGRDKKKQEGGDRERARAREKDQDRRDRPEITRMEVEECVPRNVKHDRARAVVCIDQHESWAAASYWHKAGFPHWLRDDTATRQPPCDEQIFGLLRANYLRAGLRFPLPGHAAVLLKNSYEVVRVHMAQEVQVCAAPKPVDTVRVAFAGRVRLSRRHSQKRPGPELTAQHST